MAVLGCGFVCHGPSDGRGRRTDLTVGQVQVLKNKIHFVSFFRPSL